MLTLSVPAGTKQKLLLLLRKGGTAPRDIGGMSADELSKELGITPMGVRQHLHALEKDGLLSIAPEKAGAGLPSEVIRQTGRPRLLYSLTGKAASHFPRAYEGFLLDILTAAKGAGALEKLLRLREEAFVRENAASLPEDRAERLGAFLRMLNENGYMAELEETPDAFRLKQFNCPLYEAAIEFRELCDSELTLYRALFGGGVVRETCQAGGAPLCSYLIQ